jgi:GT2 family glycosyltransferase
MTDFNTCDYPFVSLIVVNWNGKAYLNECLSVLSDQTYSPYEIIVVDNGSTDGSGDFLSQNFPHVKLVQLTENHGFAGGNAKGLEVAKGEYIALLNNDTRAEKDWLEALIQPMLDDPAIGICASKLIVTATGRLESAGDGLTTWGVGLKRGFEQDPGIYTAKGHVFGASAAACLYRRKMLDAIGFLDSDFFFNDEDTDLNFRAQLGGWKCIYVPNAIVYHRVNATIGRMSDLHVYYHARNLEFLWLKNMPTGLMLRYAHHKLLQEIGSFCYLCLRQGKWKAFFKAKRDALRLLPTMLKKRQLIQEKRKVPNWYIQSLLTPIFSGEIVRQKIRQFIKG